LDSLEERLLEEHVSHGLPKSTNSLLDLLTRIDSGFEPPDDPIDHLEGWLDSRQEWTEIAQGLWLPTGLVPPLVRPRPFRVRPVKGGPAAGLESSERNGDELRALGESPNSYEPYPDPPVERHPDSSVSWTHTLRTLHIDAAYLPVPSAARFRYPRFVGRFGPLAIKAVHHETGLEGYFWLDRDHNRFFGDMIQSLVEWEEAGRRLYLRWGPQALVISLGEIDRDVQAEEVRHVDPDALNRLRRETGESYRQSLIEVLKVNGQIPFRQLYEALAVRVGHRPSRHSLRAILSASPDFMVSGKTWEWHETAGADRSFRRAVVLSSLGLDPNAESLDVAQLAQAAAERATEWRRSTID